jgi:hypothetical protein
MARNVRVTSSERNNQCRCTELIMKSGQEMRNCISHTHSCAYKNCAYETCVACTIIPPCDIGPPRSRGASQYSSRLECRKLRRKHLPSHPNQKGTVHVVTPDAPVDESPEKTTEVPRFRRQKGRDWSKRSTCGCHAVTSHVMAKHARLD